MFYYNEICCTNSKYKGASVNNIARTRHTFSEICILILSNRNVEWLLISKTGEITPEI